MMHFSRHRFWDRCLGLAATAGLVLCLTTVAGFLGRSHWTVDLFSHFRMQYLVGLGALTLLFLIARHGRIALGFFVFTIVNLAVVVPLYVPGEWVREGVDSESFRLMLINVNTREGDPERVVEAVGVEDPDLLVLEELSPRWKEAVGRLEARYPHRRTVYREDNFGIGLFSKLPLEDAHVLYVEDKPVPSILAEVEAPSGRRFRVLATHPVPPVNQEYTRSRDVHLSALPGLVEEDMPTILAGDLNTTPWNHGFKRLLKETGLENSMRGFGVQSTWPVRPFVLRIPLDHVLHSEEFRVVDRRVGSSVGSDHFPVIVDFMW